MNGKQASGLGSAAKAGSLSLEKVNDGPDTNLSPAWLGTKQFSGATRSQDLSGNGGLPAAILDDKRRGDRDFVDADRGQNLNQLWNRDALGRQGHDHESLEIHNPKYFPPGKQGSIPEPRTTPKPAKANRWDSGRLEETPPTWSARPEGTERWQPGSSTGGSLRRWAGSTEVPARAAGPRTTPNLVPWTDGSDAGKPLEEKDKAAAKDGERAWRLGKTPAPQNEGWRRGPGTWRDGSLNLSSNLETAAPAAPAAGRNGFQGGRGGRPLASGHAAPGTHGASIVPEACQRYSKQALESVLVSMRSQVGPNLPLPEAATRDHELQEVWRQPPAPGKSPFLGAPAPEAPSHPAAALPPPGFVPAAVRQLQELAAQFAHLGFVAPLQMLLDDSYLYRDPQGVVQGPFSKEQLQAWNAAQYFPATLPTRAASVDAFAPISQYVKLWAQQDALGVTNVRLQALIDEAAQAPELAPAPAPLPAHDLAAARLWGQPAADTVWGSGVQPEQPSGSLSFGQGLQSSHLQASHLQSSQLQASGAPEAQLPPELNYDPIDDIIDAPTLDAAGGATPGSDLQPFTGWGAGAGDTGEAQAIGGGALRQDGQRERAARPGGAALASKAASVPVGKTAREAAGAGGMRGVGPARGAGKDHSAAADALQQAAQSPQRATPLQHNMLNSLFAQPPGRADGRSDSLSVAAPSVRGSGALSSLFQQLDLPQQQQHAHVSERSVEVPAPSAPRFPHAQLDGPARSDSQPLGWGAPAQAAAGKTFREIQLEELEQRKKEEHEASGAAAQSAAQDSARRAAWGAPPPRVDFRQVLEDAEECAADLEGGQCVPAACPF